MEFKEFVRDEYKYVDKYKSIYSKLNDRDTPKERRKANTVANEMQVLKSFFTELEDTEEISRSPHISPQGRVCGYPGFCAEEDSRGDLFPE